MAPLSYEIKPVTSCLPQHIGPAIAEVSIMLYKDTWEQKNKL